MVSNQYDQVAYDVSSLLERANDVSAEQLTVVTGSYSVACEQVNRRLRETNNLLRKGLRAEAIQECEREPNLLDAAESLDIHDVETWEALHRKHNLMLPPALLIQQAAELNTAYAEQAPLRELLRKHRLLALGQAPIRQRLLLLRQIADKDANNETWEKDISTYESSRFRELKTDLAKWKGSQDNRKIEELYAEIVGSPWQSAVPAEIKDTVIKLKRKHAKEAAYERLTGLAASIVHAHSELDAERAMGLRQVWSSELTAALIPGNDPLLSKVAPTFDWLDEVEQKAAAQRQFNELRLELERTLDDPASTQEDVEPLFYRLQQSDHEIPQVLKQRYQRKLHALDAHKRRGFQLKVFAIVGSLLILAALAYSFVQRARFNAEVQKSSQSLDQHAQNGEWDKGLQFKDDVNATSPKIFNHVTFQESVTEFDGAYASHLAAVATYDAALVTAKTLAAKAETECEALEAAPSSDQSVSLRNTLQELSLQVPQLSRGPAVQAELTVKHDLLKAKLVTVVDAEILKMIRPLKTEVARLRDRSKLNSFSPSRLSQLEDQLDAAFNAYPSIDGSSVAHEQATIKGVISEINDRRAEHSDFIAAKNSVTEAVGDPERFRKALTDLADANASNPWASQWRRAAEDAPWVKVLDWLEFGNSRLTDIRRLTTTDAGVVQAKAKELGAAPLPSWERKLSTVKSIAKRRRNLRRTEFTELGQWWMDVNFVEYERDGKLLRAYDVDLENNTAAVNLTNKRDRRTLIGNAKKRPAPTASPQKVVSARIRSLLGQVDESAERDARQWDIRFHEIIQLLANDKRGKALDPVLRLALLQHFVEVAITGSDDLAKSYRRVNDQFEFRKGLIQRIANSNWLLNEGLVLKVKKPAPGVPNVATKASVEDTRAVRRDAKQILESVLKDMPKTFQISRNYSSTPTMDWVGWLDRDAKGEPSVAFSEEIARGNLAVFRGKKFESIGTVEAGKPNLSAKASSVVSGQPVFFYRSSKK